jgi:hypothetical protein
MPSKTKRKAAKRPSRVVTGKPAAAKPKGRPAKASDPPQPRGRLPW